MNNPPTRMGLRSGALVLGLSALLLAGCASNTQSGTGTPAQLTNAMPLDNDVIFGSNTNVVHAVYDEGFDLDMANADIWQRIRSGFAMADLSNNRVTEKENWYASRSQYFIRTGERARRYLYYVVEELDKRNMPMELALLPFVESAFNPQAVSSAQAAGMWQFIPSTGRNFNLQQDIFRDERRDVIASTNAALDYLQTLYAMFGDWHLALAAYNCGEGTVMRAIQRNQREGKPTDYANLQLPLETQNYVPALQALKNLVGDPLGYKIELPLIPNHPFFQVLAIDRDIDVDLAAQLAGISIDEFRALNPAANKPVILAEATSQVLLPWDNAAIFMQGLSRYEGSLSSWRVWRAPSTMSVAQAARATGMSAQQLSTVNDIPLQAYIKQGSALLVTRSEMDDANVSLALIDGASLQISRTATSRHLSTPSKIAVNVPAHGAAQPGAQTRQPQVANARASTASTPSKAPVSSVNTATRSVPAAAQTAIDAQTTAIAPAQSATRSGNSRTTPSKVAIGGNSAATAAVSEASSIQHRSVR